MPELVVPSYAVGFIYIQGKLDFVPSLMCSLMMCANNQLHYDSMVVFICLHITLHHHYGCTDVCEWNELLKCLSISFYLYHAIYEAVCIRLVNFPCDHDNYEDTCTISDYHCQIRSMNHLSLLMVGSWNNGIRCISYCALSKWPHGKTEYIKVTYKRTW